MRPTRRDVRDHIKHSKNGCWRSYRFYRALQRLKAPTCIICENFEAPRFRVFNTIGQEQTFKFIQPSTDKLLHIHRRIICILRAGRACISAGELSVR